MITQSNPIIFVGLEQGAEIWNYLSPTLDSFARGNCYIEPKANFTEQWIKNEIGRVWKKILAQGDCTADIVRVNYIICTSSIGQMLPKLREYIEKYLLALYPAGVLVDVYCLLDDNRLLDSDDCRKQVMAILKDEQKKGANVYLLSNLTSQNTIITKRSIAHTIAMLTLFKDFVPTSYVTGADASRYNEFYFYDNCYSRQGQFFTASSLNVTIPRDGLRALLMAEMLSFGKDKKTRDIPLNEATFFATNTTQQPVPQLEYLLGMAIPNIDSNKKQSRRQWISELFGKRLNHLLTNEINNSDHFPDLITDDANFYDLLHLTCEDGVYRNILASAIKDCEYELQTEEDNFQKWLDFKPDFNKSINERRKLSPLVSQELWPYKIASEFLQKQSKLQALQNKLIVYESRRQSIEVAHKGLLELLENVNLVVKEYMEKSHIIDEAFAPFNPNASCYFRSLFAEYSKLYNEELTELSAKMTTALMQGNFHAYVDHLSDYVDDNILPSFNKSIMDTMYDLVSLGGGDISTALGDWIFNHRRWNIRLKTGYASLHTEINVYMPTQGAAELKRRYEERGLGRMNLFTDSNANSVSVLYHSGTFNIEDLFYESLYVNNDVGDE